MWGFHDPTANPAQGLVQGTDRAPAHSPHAEAEAQVEMAADTSQQRGEITAPPKKKK